MIKHIIYKCYKYLSLCSLGVSENAWYMGVGSICSRLVICYLLNNCWHGSSFYLEIWSSDLGDLMFWHVCESGEDQKSSFAPGYPSQLVNVPIKYNYFINTSLLHIPKQVFLIFNFCLEIIQFVHPTHFQILSTRLLSQLWNYTPTIFCLHLKPAFCLFICLFKKIILIKTGYIQAKGNLFCHSVNDLCIYVEIRQFYNSC